MQPSFKYLKGSVRHAFKYGGALLRGYPFGYAHRQDGSVQADYPHLWSRCTTPIKQRSGLANINENRLWNMQLATRAVDGLILQPGQRFGFWCHVPRPTLANGFRAGPMLVRGKLTADVGGGLCQISTTLFQALLWANFQILERHNHSIDAHGAQRFFTLGQDAAVVYGYKDLIAKNQSPIALRLQLQVLPATAAVTASIWGTAPIPLQVKVESQVLEHLPAPCAGGKDGYRVQTLRAIQSIAPDDRASPWQTNYTCIDTYQPHAAIR